MKLFLLLIIASVVSARIIILLCKRNELNQYIDKYKIGDLDKQLIIVRFRDEIHDLQRERGDKKGKLVS